MTSCVITGRTRICGIIGDPVEHTISPAMHNAAFRKLGLDFVYVPFRVKPVDLPAAVGGMRGLNIRGINVTIPHKVETMEYLDDIDPLAEKIGAVNVIVNEDGRLKGYNTDAEGFLRSLLEKGIDVREKKIGILGAGGASRAIAFILAENDAHLAIFNRTVHKAAELAAAICRITGKKVSAFNLAAENLKEAMQGVEILINATSVGMSPDAAAIPVPVGLIRPEMVVVDIIYNPLKTRLLSEAEKAGATTINGVDMLVWQGALAFEKWTGHKAPLETMKRAARRVLAI